MDDDATTRAIMIGAGLLVAIVTISLVLTYYNSARAAARAAGTGVDYDIRYRNDIEITLEKAGNVNANVSAQEIINLIYYFQNNQTVDINLSNLRTVNSDGNIDEGIIKRYDQVNTRNDSEIARIIREINKGANYLLERADTSNKKVLNIKEKSNGV